MKGWAIQLNDKFLALNTEPLPTWPLGGLGSVGSLGVLSTRTINIRSTPEADSFFGFLRVYNVKNDIIKQENVINLLYDMQPVIYKAILSKIEVKDDGYSLILAGDNAILTNKFKGKISDLPLDTLGYKIMHEAAEIDAALGGSLGDFPKLAYLNSRDAANSANWIATVPVYANPKNENNLNIFSPFASVYNLFVDMIANAGLSYSDETAGGLLSSNLFKSLYLSTNSFNLPVYEPVLVSSGDISGSVSEPITGTIPIDFSPIFETEFFSTEAIDQRFINCLRDGQKHAVVTLTKRSAATGFNILVFDENNLNIATILAASGEYVIDISNVQSIRFELNPFVALAYDITLDIKLEVLQTEMAARSEFVGAPFYLSANAPEITQIDLLKLVMNKFALMAITDPFTNTIRFSDYKAILQQDSFDITQYVVNSNKASFDLFPDLAQQNTLVFNNDEGITAIAGRGVFNVDIPSLPSSDPYFSTSLSYSSFVNSDGAQVCVLPYFEASGGSASLVNMRTRLVRKVNAGLMPIAALDGVDFQYSVDNFYTDFVASLDDYRLVTIQALLPYDIVQKLTTLGVVRIDNMYISGLFLVVKIDRWTDKKPVSVTLRNIL